MCETVVLVLTLTVLILGAVASIYDDKIRKRW